MSSIDNIKLHILDKIRDPGLRAAPGVVHRHTDWKVFSHTQLYLDRRFKAQLSDLVERVVFMQSKCYTSENINKVIDVFY